MMMCEHNVVDLYSAKCIESESLLVNHLYRRSFPRALVAVQAGLRTQHNATVAITIIRERNPFGQLHDDDDDDDDDAYGNDDMMILMKMMMKTWASKLQSRSIKIITQLSCLNDDDDDNDDVVGKQQLSLKFCVLTKNLPIISKEINPAFIKKRKEKKNSKLRVVETCNSPFNRFEVFHFRKFLMSSFAIFTN